ncbi:hypothetical protein N657DRAFT_46295 [Parathielavia appendiculata]|uniref:Uncharacterized protein n=1 Tax=Parathielavia appendiculata TaxID=2587402 RepID=A0AAN6UA91_9PEZI|nr:hypothetical protein N657DRAFT_46295 [Parathielavia appendiculata]
MLHRALSALRSGDTSFWSQGTCTLSRSVDPWHSQIPGTERVKDGPYSHPVPAWRQHWNTRVHTTQPSLVSVLFARFPAPALRAVEIDTGEVPMSQCSAPNPGFDGPGQKYLTLLTHSFSTFSSLQSRLPPCAYGLTSYLSTVLSPVVRLGSNCIACCARHLGGSFKM